MMEVRTSEEPDEPAHIARVQDWLVSQFGPIRSFELIPSPHEHRTHYPVAFVTTEQGQQLVAKWDKRADKLQKEAAVATLLIAHQIPTAAVYACDPTVPVLTMERLYGQPLRDGALSETTVEEIGGLLRKIHDIPLADVLGAGVPAWRGTDFASEMGAKFSERIQGAVSLLPEDLTALQLETMLQTLLKRNQWVGRRALNRRDMHAQNWFRLDDGRLAAIDHGNASVGDIAYDLAHALSNLGLVGATRSAFRAGYGSEAFDAVTGPDTLAISDLVHGIGILGWVKQRGVSQPRFQAEAYDLIQRAVEQSRI